MPTIPRSLTITNASVDILNAIRNNASTNYQNKVPIATNNAEVIKSIGAVLMDFPALLNEFRNALVNRIGRVLIKSKLYESPLAVLKKGILDYGESTEEIFIEMAKPQQYDPEYAETNVFNRELPDIKSAFHVINYKKFFKTTVQDNDIKQAFLNEGGVIDLIEKKYYLYEIILFFSEQFEMVMNSTGNPSRDTVLDDILYYIDHNYKTNIKLESIAPLFGYNSAYLGKIFTKTTGESFNSYVDNRRIEHSKELLMENKLKVYEIAEQVGYKNVDYFHKKFKKQSRNNRL